MPVPEQITLTPPSWWRVALQPGLVKRSSITALVVGSLLTIINQNQAVFGEAQLNLVTMLLTYMVPYCVSTFSGTTSYLSHYKALPETCSEHDLLGENTQDTALKQELANKLEAMLACINDDKHTNEDKLKTLKSTCRDALTALLAANRTSD